MCIRDRSGAAIFEVHQMMLDDDDYLDSIHNIIRTESVNAEYALSLIPIYRNLFSGVCGDADNAAPENSHHYLCFFHWKRLVRLHL